MQINVQPHTKLYFFQSNRASLSTMLCSNVLLREEGLSYVQVTFSGRSVKNSFPANASPEVGPPVHSTVPTRSNKPHGRANRRLCVNQGITFINWIFPFLSHIVSFYTMKSQTLLEAIRSAAISVPS